MDYEEERCGELEALVSIYCDDIEVLDEAHPRRFRIGLRSSDSCQDDEGGALECSLVFVHTPKYPDEPPEVACESGCENLEETDLRELERHLLALAAENLGTVMIFTLAAGAQEWLDAKSDDIKRRREEGELKKRLAEEEAEMKRFEGTRVTVETFLAWRNAFELETGIVSKREKDLKEKGKLTGKELFLRDTTLNESDLKFLDDGDAVKVDESLFQDLDDLDLSDDEDDEDYVPGESGDDD